MRQPKWYNIYELLEMIMEPNRSACEKYLRDNWELLTRVQGSTHNHQAWPGGYLDHITDAMNLAIVDFMTFNAIRRLPFTLSDLLFCIFWHDSEKPSSYEVGPDGTMQRIEALRSKPAQHAFRARRLEEYGVVLTPEQANALKYCEGEMGDYSNEHRAMGPLAAFCHRADIMSARVYFDYPKEQGDPWQGASRCRHKGDE